MSYISKNRKHAHGVPDYEQGAWIGYRLKVYGIRQQDIADKVGVSRQMVQQVAYGLRTSHRVQKAIALALGYDSWAELIANSRRVAA